MSTEIDENRIGSIRVNGCTGMYAIDGKSVSNF